MHVCIFAFTNEKREMRNEYTHQILAVALTQATITRSVGEEKVRVVLTTLWV